MNTITVDSYTVHSYAKINLALDVVGLREDGMHLVDMVMHAISLGDEIILRVAECAAGAQGCNAEACIEVTTDSGEIPLGRDNLAFRAAELILPQSFYENRNKLRIHIKKSIPVAAGLAGGSGNAAAVLLGLNHLLKLDLSLDELLALGGQLGSDVPFCLLSMAGQADLDAGGSSMSAPDAGGRIRCARATGTGTDLEVLPSLAGYVLIAKPPISVMTGEVYKGIDGIEIQQRPDIEKMCLGLAAGNRAAVTEEMINVLELYTLSAYPEVGELKRLVEDFAPETEKVLMSGSGPTVYAIFSEQDSCIKAFNNLKTAFKDRHFRDYFLWWGSL